MQQQFAGQIDIIGIGGGSTSADELERFVHNYGAGELTHVSDTDNSIWERYGVFSQPTYAFIDNDGTIQVTRLPVRALAERIARLLG